MTDETKTREEYLALLREKARLLLESGENRYPRRSDFSDRDVMGIKAYFGPWPRALEAAGIKPPRDDDRLEKNREKRIRAKRRRNAARKAQMQHTPSSENAPSIPVPHEEEH